MASRRRSLRTVGPVERLRSICLALPEAAEGVNHSRPCFEVGGKTFVMFMDNHHGDGRVAIGCGVERRMPVLRPGTADAAER